MHVTSYICARLFFEMLARGSQCAPHLEGCSLHVMDLGSMDVNGSIRRTIEDAQRFGQTFAWSYTGVDATPGPNVDVVVPPGAALPFSRESFDIVVSSSALAHDTRFWVTFAAMARLVKPGGLIYINVPSSGGYNAHPIDAFRFYPDAAGALAQWATDSGAPLRLVHSSIDPHEHTLAPNLQGHWHDHVMIYRRDGGARNAAQDARLERFADEFSERAMDTDQIYAALTAMNCHQHDGITLCTHTGECVRWRWSPEAEDQRRLAATPTEAPAEATLNTMPSTRWPSERDLFEDGIVAHVQRTYEFVGPEEYGYMISLEMLDSESIIYSFGLGVNADFDLDMINHTHASVHAFDNTPVSNRWYESSRANGAFPPEFVHHPFLLAPNDTEIEMALPKGHASSFASLESSSKGFYESSVVRVPARSLVSHMRALGHERLDVLKLDIEGAEFGILRALADKGSGGSLPACQLLIGFHGRLVPEGEAAKARALDDLSALGFVVVANRQYREGDDALFVNPRFCPPRNVVRQATCRGMLLSRKILVEDELGHPQDRWLHWPRGQRAHREVAQMFLSRVGWSGAVPVQPVVNDMIAHETATDQLCKRGKHEEAAIVVYGLATRSPSVVAASVLRYAIAPLREAGFEPHIYLHAWDDVSAIVNKRTGERCDALPSLATAHLAFEAMDVPMRVAFTSQAIADAEVRPLLDAANSLCAGRQQQGDEVAWLCEANLAEVRLNLLRELHSLHQATALWDYGARSQATPPAIVMHIHADVELTSRLAVPEVISAAYYAPIGQSAPDFAKVTDLNDRVGLGRADVMRQVGRRLDRIQSTIDLGIPLHSEVLLGVVVHAIGATPFELLVEAVRRRCDGRVETRDAVVNWSVSSQRFVNWSATLDHAGTETTVGPDECVGKQTLSPELLTQYHDKLPAPPEAELVDDGDNDEPRQAYTSGGLFEDALASTAPERLATLERAHRDVFASAMPFPHAVIDDFFPARLARAVEAEFPAGSDELDALCREPARWAASRWNTSWKCFTQPGVQHLKMASEDEPRFGAASHAAFAALKSAGFVAFLERLTGIADLVPDPRFRGAGLHQTLRGGQLAVQADFNRHRGFPHLVRRVNVFVYVTEGWERAWGGELELWDERVKTCAQQLPPLFNRLVVFASSDASFHGHPEPLASPASHPRRSLAMYYYTVEPDADRVVAHSTQFYIGTCDAGTGCARCRPNTPAYDGAQAPLDDARAPRLAVVAAFGLANRAPAQTIPSLARHVFAPLRAAGFEVRLFAHSWSDVDELLAERSRESCGSLPDVAATRREFLAAAPGATLEFTPQADADAELAPLFAATRGASAGIADDWNHNAKQARNVLRQLASLARVTRMWTRAALQPELVVAVRADLEVLSPLVVPQPLPDTYFSPSWHSGPVVDQSEHPAGAFEGLNDRIGVGAPAVMRAVGERITHVESILDALRNTSRHRRLHSETLLGYFVSRVCGFSNAGLLVKAVRRRCDGRVENTDAVIADPRFSAEDVAGMCRYGCVVPTDWKKFQKWQGLTDSEEEESGENLPPLEIR